MSKYSKILKMTDLGYWVAGNKTLYDVSFPMESHLNLLEIEDSSFWFQHRNNCILEVIHKCPPKGLIFDIGGGNGVVSKHLSQSYEVVVVEPGLDGVINSVGRGIPNVIYSTLSDAEFEPGSLPAVGIFDVLEHIEDDSLFLDEIHMLLENDGRLYLTVPAYRFLWSSEDDFAGHYRRYTLKQLHKKLNAAGFDVDYSTYFFALLPIPIFFIRTIASWLGIRKHDLSSHIKEHNSGKFNYFLSKYLHYEINKIKHGRLKLGGSCLISATKRVKN